MDVVFGNPIPTRTMAPLEPIAFVIPMEIALKGNGFQRMGQEPMQPKRNCSVLRRLAGVMGMAGGKIRSPMEWKLESVWKREDMC